MTVDSEDIDPEDIIEQMQWDGWCERLKAVSRAAHSLNFRIGDLLNEGAEVFDRKKTYTAVAQATGFPRARLYELASVAAAVPISLRNENLDWSHHRAVSKLPPERQIDWLAEAENGHLSVTQLRAKIKARRYNTSPAGVVAKPDAIAARKVITHKWDAKRRVFVLLYGEQEKRLEKLLKAKGKSIDSYVSDLVHQDLASLETLAAIENDALTRQMLAAEQRGKGRDRYVKKIRASIEALFEELETGESGVDCSDFVKIWEERHGKKFPYLLARSFSIWTDRYAFLTEEDCACGEYSRF